MQGTLNVNVEENRIKAAKLNNATILLTFLITVFNVIVVGFVPICQ